MTNWLLVDAAEANRGCSSEGRAKSADAKV